MCILTLHAKSGIVSLPPCIINKDKPHYLLLLDLGLKKSSLSNGVLSYSYWDGNIHPVAHTSLMKGSMGFLRDIGFSVALLSIHPGTVYTDHAACTSPENCSSLWQVSMR